ncbi:DUF333 domain-containing protein [Candidatus Parcubacteria bacterium]|nr:DUF333 domain-containing protein [Candidatus Parcubacteria bacterium]
MRNKKNKKNYFNKKLFGILFIIISICVCTNSVKSMAQPSPELLFRPAPNPAAAYCEDLGYEYSIKSTKEGDYGMCLLPDGSEVEEWKFLEGKTGEEYSYCHQKGYSIKTISGEKCNYSAECAVCILDDNTEVEVTQLVKQEKELEKSQLKDGSMEREIKKFDIKIIIAISAIAIIIAIMAAAYWFLVRKKENCKKEKN